MQHTGIVADHGPIAFRAIAIAQHAKVDAFICGKRDAANNGSREGGQQQEHEGDEE